MWRVDTSRQQGAAQRTGRRVETAVLAVSLLAGAYLMAIAIASAGHAWLGWFSLFPLFVAVRVQRPIGAMLSGALWGLGLYSFLLLSGVYGAGGAGGPPIEGWLMSSDMGGAIRWTGIPISILGLPLPLVLLTAVPAIYAFLASWLTRRIGYSPFVLGVGWIGVELALAPLGLRYGLLAGAQGDAWVFHIVGHLLGYVFVAFLAAYVSALLVTLLARVGVAVASVPKATTSGETETVLFPQTFSCFPLFAIPPSHPRGPPTPLAYA